MTGAWVLDVHLDTETRGVRLTATDLTSKAVHIEPLELLTVAAVREAVQRLIAQHGRPASILTDHGRLWSGLGDAIGVEHRFPAGAVSLAWFERLARRAAA